MTHMQDEFIKAVRELPDLDDNFEGVRTRGVACTLSNGWVYEIWESTPNGRGDDLYCFGRVHGFETELGYFTTDMIKDYIIHWHKAEWTTEEA